MRHYSRKVDGNHAEIRDSLRKIPNMRVADLSRAGQGVPDLLCKFGDKALLVEVKVKGGGLTDKEQQFAEYWGDGYIVAYKFEDVLTEFGLM